jgi:antitoxin MazE
MKVAVRRMGNSRGVLIPKPILAQTGLAEEATLTVENGAIVLRPIRPNPREGWAEASRKLAAAQDDALVWPEFGNADDDGLQW